LPAPGDDRSAAVIGLFRSGMTRLLALALLLLPLQRLQAAPTPIGLWLTEDREGVIAITPCGTELCARIVGFFLDRPGDPTPVDHRGVSQCNLPLINDATQVGPNLWKGHITDPRNGNVYGVELHLDPRGDLTMRGFFAVPLLGRTQTWTRYQGPLPADCRIMAASG
jgi:uncharacterized protein (DUF2147 family)